MFSYSSHSSPLLETWDSRPCQLGQINTVGLATCDQGAPAVTRSWSVPILPSCWMIEVWPAQGFGISPSSCQNCWSYWGQAMEREWRCPSDKRACDLLWLAKHECCSSLHSVKHVSNLAGREIPSLPFSMRPGEPGPLMQDFVISLDFPCFLALLTH